MDDATAFTHARARDHDEGPLLVVERLGQLARLHVVHAVRMEGIPAFADELLGLGVVALGVVHEGRGGLPGQRRVDEDGDLGNGLPPAQAGQRVDEILGAPDAEGRHEDLAAGALHAAEDGHERLFRVLDGLVLAQAVGGLREDDVRPGQRLGVAEDGIGAAPQVAREVDAEAVVPLQEHAGRAEDVARVPERGPEALDHVERLVVRMRAEALERTVHVLLDVERLDRGPRGVAALVQVAGVGLVEVRRVGEHGPAQVAGGGGRVDATGVAAPDQGRQRTAVVDVGVGEDDGLEIVRQAQMPVALLRFAARPLHQTAVEQHARPAEAQEVPAAGDGPRGTEGLEDDGSVVHGISGRGRTRGAGGG